MSRKKRYTPALGDAEKKIVEPVPDEVESNFDWSSVVGPEYATETDSVAESVDVFDEEIASEDKIPPEDVLTHMSEEPAPESAVDDVVIDVPDAAVEAAFDEAPTALDVEPSEPSAPQESQPQEIDVATSKRPDDIEARIFAEQAEANRIRLEAELESEMGRAKAEREAALRKETKKRKALEEKHRADIAAAEKRYLAAKEEARKAGVE